jgi:hypothetical protein
LRPPHKQGAAVAYTALAITIAAPGMSAPNGISRAPVWAQYSRARPPWEPRSDLTPLAEFRI